MSKYEVWFCDCGRIHLMDNKYLDWMQEDSKNRSVIRVCRNCGNVQEMFLDENICGGYDICATDNIPEEFDSSPDTHFIFSKGIQVPMMSGGYATYRSPTGRWYTDPVVHIYGEETASKNYIVDTKSLIKEIRRDYKDQAEDILKSISGYVSGIDWTGTEYERI